MIKSIGIIDFDAICQKKYVAPNYDIGLIYNYLKQDPNVSVRLVTSLKENNLDKYNELLIFKKSKYLPHPSAIIQKYYNKNIKEYGEGFINRPARPFFKETLYSKPDFSCYNPILSFSFYNPSHPNAWSLNRAMKSAKRQQIRLYEKVEDEYLRRDFPTKKKMLVIHDDPTVLLNEPEQLETVKELFDKKYHLFFTQPLDISLLKDTNIIERVIIDEKFASLRNDLIISEHNDKADYFIGYYLNHKCKKTDVSVLYEKGKSKDYYMRSMLDLNYYNNKTGYILRLRPYWDKEIMLGSSLTHCLYRFLYEKPYLMSFYEYIFYISCRNLKVPNKLIRTNEETYDFILSKYGMDKLLMKLEDWILENPDYEEKVFIGGSSNYEEQRRKAYDPRRSKYAFRGSSNGISEKRSS